MKNTILSTIANDLLNDGLTITIAARGRSMLPFIRDNDTVHIKPIDPTRLRRGDIALFSTPDGQLVVHRMVGYNGPSRPPRYIMRGDSILHHTEEVSHDNILGQVTCVKRGKIQRQLDAGIYRWAGIMWVKLHRCTRALHYLYRVPRKIVRRVEFHLNH